MFRHLRTHASQQRPLAAANLNPNPIAMNYHYQGYEPQLPAIYKPQEADIRHCGQQAAQTLNKRQRYQHQHQHLHQHQSMTVDRHFLREQSSRPLCRCRVIYLGSSVPHKTKNGLHGIQDPLKSLYPEERFQYPTKEGASVSAAPQLEPVAAAATHNTVDISHLSSSLGIDSWLSVWSNGLLLENVDEFGRDVKRFFSIESLHYCAAVRFFDTKKLANYHELEQETSPVGADRPTGNSGSADDSRAVDHNNNSSHSNSQLSQDEQHDSAANKPKRLSQDEASKRKSSVKFLPLDAPLFQCPGMMDTKHPPVFSAILRRTSGIKVLECHSFICRRDAAANALVRCCTHAYANLISGAQRGLGSVGSSYVEPKPSSTLRSFGVASGSVGGGNRSRQSRSMRSAVLSRRRSEQFSDDDDDDEAHGDSVLRAARQNRHQLSSLGGTTSNDNTTNGTDPSSSGDDNYAIISKGHSKPTTTNAKTTERRRHKSKDRKGSSRSLFDNFQPVEADTQARGPAELYPAPATSHSLDFLSEPNKQNETPNPSGSERLERRHSRSMQNLRLLDRPNDTANSYCSGPKTRSPVKSSASRKSTNRRQHHKQSQHKKSSKSEASRSASCHDIFMDGPGSKFKLSTTNNNDYEELNVVSKVSNSRSQHKPEPMGATKISSKSKRGVAHYGSSGTATPSKLSARSRPPLIAFDNDARYHQPNPVSVNSSTLYRSHPQYATPMGPVCPLGTPAIYLPASYSVSASGHTLPTRQLNVTNGNLAAQCYDQSPYYHPGFVPAPAGPQPNYYAAHPLHQYPCPMPGLHMNSAAFRLGPGSSATMAPQRRPNKQRHHSSNYEHELAARFRCLSPPANLLAGHKLSSAEGSGFEERASKQQHQHQHQQQQQQQQQLLLLQQHQRQKQQGDGHDAGSAGSSPIDMHAANSIVTEAPPFLPHPASSDEAPNTITNNLPDSVINSPNSNPANPSTESKRISWIKRLSLTLSNASVETSSSVRNDPSGDCSNHSRRSLDANADSMATVSALSNATQSKPDENTKVRRTKKSGLFAGSLTLGRRSKAAAAAKQQQQQLKQTAGA